MTPIPAKEKAASFLLKPPALRYIRSLKKLLDRDPGYLDAHREDIGNIVIGFLSGAGFQWHRQVFEREWPDILQDALAQLDNKKK